MGNNKWMVQGRGQGDRPIRVVFLIDPDKTIYIIHAMPLTTRRRRSR
jgi:alkyl hydroperoxide reductase subunit AhpC